MEWMEYCGRKNVCLFNDQVSLNDKTERGTREWLFDCNEEAIGDLEEIFFAMDWRLWKDESYICPSSKIDVNRTY